MFYKDKECALKVFFFFFLVFNGEKWFNQQKILDIQKKSTFIPQNHFFFFLLLFVSCKNYFTNHIMYKIVRKNTIHVFLYFLFFSSALIKSLKSLLRCWWSMGRRMRWLIFPMVWPCTSVASGPWSRCGWRVRDTMM